MSACLRNFSITSGKVTFYKSVSVLSDLVRLYTTICMEDRGKGKRHRGKTQASDHVTMTLRHLSCWIEVESITGTLHSMWAGFAIQ